MDVEVFIPDTPLFDLGNVEENLPIHVNITDDPGFVCDRCNSTFRSKALLRDHIIRKYIITNPDDFEHPCDECGKKFPTNYSLKAHIRNKKARQTKIGCIICNKNVTRKEWPNHFAMHNNADKFNCNICEKVCFLSDYM
jgi:Zinc finger, C2H2 type